MKKFISILLVAVLTFSLLSISSFAFNENSNDVARGDFDEVYIVYVNGVKLEIPRGTIVGYNHTTAGVYVMHVQAILDRIDSLYRDANCYSGGIDGEFGANTFNAVSNFQYFAKLTRDGVVGANTWNAFAKYSS